MSRKFRPGISLKILNVPRYISYFYRNPATKFSGSNVKHFIRNGINGKLAEIFFDKKAGKPVIWGHCYVKKEEYKTKKEQKWIAEDTKKFRIIYRKKKYAVKYAVQL